MPVGLAGVLTLLAGMGIAFVGMAQTWVRLPFSTLNPKHLLKAAPVCWPCRQTNRHIWWRCGQLLRARACDHALSRAPILGAEEIRTVIRLVGFSF